MKYYKYLDLDYKRAVDSLRSYVTLNRSMIKSFWTYLDTNEVLKLYPEVQEMFNPLNIHIKTISVIASSSTSLTEGIHRDYVENPVRINLPLLNCEGSVTNFYRTTVEPEKKYLPNGIPYNKIEYKNCVLVDSFCLDRPAALRVKEPHQVVANKLKLPRISCTIDFIEDIEYLLED